MKRQLLHVLVPAALTLSCSALQAGGLKVYGNGEIPDARDVARMLGGRPAPERPKMRGISLEPAYDREAPKQKALQKIAEPDDSAFALPVRFAFNSAEILPEARPQLDAVAKGIKMVPGAKVVVEGHTDASGSAAYNLRLSMMRAKAVKDYLVYKHGIDPSALLVEGKGEENPINPTDPYGPENRAVAFRPAR